MKQDKRQKIYAWFEPSKGPCDIIGVRLAYVDPCKTHFEKALAQANVDKDTPRALSILHSKSYYETRKQKYFTPDVGWWMNEKEYREDHSGFGGITRTKVEEEYFSIAILDSRDEAIAAAEKAGII